MLKKRLLRRGGAPAARTVMPIGRAQSGMAMSNMAISLRTYSPLNRASTL